MIELNNNDTLTLSLRSSDACIPLTLEALLKEIFSHKAIRGPDG